LPGKYGRFFRVAKVCLPTEGMAKVGLDAGRDIALIALVIGLVLEEDELVALVIGTIVCEVGH
jgi:hypothetical protein